MNFIRNVTNRDIEEASRALIDGNLVAFPTETVYGLGADATNQAAVNRMYEVKGRPKNHPVIVHVSSFEKIKEWAVEIPAIALELGKKYWPGPLTLVLKRSKIAQDFITGGQDSVAIRVPNHPVALKLLRTFEELGGKGIVAPSANLFGRVSPTQASHVQIDLKYVLSENDYVLDGGECDIGIESTIISCLYDSPKVLRPGFISLADASVSLNIDLKKIFQQKEFIELRVPGKLNRHYAPETQINLNGEYRKGDGIIALSNFKTPAGTIRLCSPTSLKEFAKVLYSSMRLADSLKLKRVTIIFDNKVDINGAIFDRLKKASSN